MERVSWFPFVTFPTLLPPMIRRIRTENILSKGCVILFLLVCLSLSSEAQRRCGTLSYRELLRSKDSSIEHVEQFENWIKNQISTRRDQASGRSKAQKYTVQVVVHVIHNGEAFGQGTNISDAQVQSQLAVLNADFKRLNTDAINTPAEFLPIAGGIDIEFKLALIDPEGHPSNGINRVKGSKANWSMADDKELKALSSWNTNDYLNIWVCNLTDYAGYSQFPLSTLAGLENSSTNPLTDGIVIRYKAFGSSDYGNFDLESGLNKGRTATHEAGHFFGLRHIWGDVNDCDGTDYVDDTPPQAGSSSGCPTHPQKQCPSEQRSVMFQNFLDLTDDGCMNLFTNGQVIRMETVLESSPRRASLLTATSPTVAARQFEKLFSPNGDGVNDYWRWFDYDRFEGCKLTVFNRFGKAVYETSTYDGSWDGRSSDGHMLEEEAYFFVIRCSGDSDITGGVRIVR